MGSYPTMAQVHEWCRIQEAEVARRAAMYEANVKRYLGAKDFARWKAAADDAVEQARILAEIERERKREHERKLQQQLARQRAAAQRAEERRIAAAEAREAAAAEERAALVIALQRERRSRTNWAEHTGDLNLASRQESWERRATILRMRETGATFDTIAKRFGISRARAAQIVHQAERERAAGYKSPVEQWQAYNAALGMTLDQPRKIRRLAATLAVLYAPQRDWLMVASRGHAHG